MCPGSEVNNANAPCSPNPHLPAVMACAHHHLEKNVNFQGQWGQQQLEMLICYVDSFLPSESRQTHPRPTVSHGCGSGLWRWGCPGLSTRAPGVSEPSRPRAALPRPMGLCRIVVLLSTVSLWCQRDRHEVMVLYAEHVVTQTGKRV